MPPFERVVAFAYVRLPRSRRSPAATAENVAAGEQLVNRQAHGGSENWVGSSMSQEPAVDDELCAGDERRIAARQERNRTGDL